MYDINIEKSVQSQGMSGNTCTGIKNMMDQKQIQSDNMNIMQKVIETNNEEERTKLRSAAATFKNLAMGEWCNR